MQYGEPFTPHRAVLDTWSRPTTSWSLYGGITNGWDNFSDPINILAQSTNLGLPGREQQCRVSRRCDDEELR